MDTSLEQKLLVSLKTEAIMIKCVKNDFKMSVNDVSFILLLL